MPATRSLAVSIASMPGQRDILAGPAITDPDALQSLLDLAQTPKVENRLTPLVFGATKAGVSYHPKAYLFVTADERGTGTGRALIEAVYAAADAAGRPDVYWLTQADNHQARALYDRIGRSTPFIKYRR